MKDTIDLVNIDVGCPGGRTIAMHTRLDLRNMKLRVVQVITVNGSSYDDLVALLKLWIKDHGLEAALMNDGVGMECAVLDAVREGDNASL